VQTCVGGELRGSGERARRRIYRGALAGAFTVCVLLCALGGVAACGEESPETVAGTGDVTASTATATASSDSVSVIWPTGPATASTDTLATGATSSTSDSEVFAEIFVDVARAATPMIVYGLAELPSGATISQEWWPLVELDSPDEYEGPSVTNPRFSGGGEDDPEIQLLLEYRGGWAMILENFRGDLGDMRGDPVGKVAGRTATLYGVNGGTLVQWSDGGRWYGVFCRGVPSEDVVAMSLKMRPVSAEGPDG
jgi:hypothetical protein